MFYRFFFPMFFLAFMAGCSSTAVHAPYATDMTRETIQSDMARASAAYLSARVALSRGENMEAALFLKKALEKTPNDPILLRQTFFLLLREGLIEETVPLAERILALKQSGRDLPILVLALKDVKEDRIGEAKIKTALLQSYPPNNILLPLLNAWIGSQTPDQKDPISLLAELKQKKEFKALYHFHAGLIADLTDRTDLARTHYETTLKTSGGLSVRALQVIGNFYLRQGEKEKALSLVEGYLKTHRASLAVRSMLARFQAADPANTVKEVALIKNGLAEAFFGLSATMSQVTDFETAVVFARLALYLKPDFGLAKILLADLLDVQKKSKDAIAVLEGVNETADSYVPAQLRIASGLRKTGQDDAAIPLLKKLSRLYPDVPSTHADLGDIYRSKGNFKAAIKSYQKAIDSLKAVTPHHWSLFYTLGIALEQSGQWETAEKAFLRALTLVPNHPLVLNYLGYSWLQKGMHTKEAILMIKKAVAQRPTDGFIVDSLGWAFYLTSNFEEAVKILERAIDLEPGNSVLNDHLGDAYWRVGRRREACFQWQRAITLSKEDPDELEDPEATRRKCSSDNPPVAKPLMSEAPPETDLLKFIQPAPPPYTPIPDQNLPPKPERKPPVPAETPRATEKQPIAL